ncbi:MAG: hypothetical protein SFV52_08945 [Saprospiraceae bacterium]|nr:hypothetical protein [Saprospiraceae bacterium]
MKHSLITLSLLVLAFNSLFGLNEPRPLLASATTIENNIIIAVGNEDNSELGTLFVLQGASGLERDFSIGKITRSDKYVIFWPTDDMARPIVLALENSLEYLQVLNEQEKAKAQVFTGYGLARMSKTVWSGDYAKSVNDLRAGKYNDVFIH